MRILLLVLLLIVIGLSVLMRDRGFALAKCPPGRPDTPGNYIAEWWNRPAGQAPGGVYSAILNYDPWVQPGRLSTGWSMLSRPGTPNRWAQVGWKERAYDQNRKTVVQYHNHSGTLITLEDWGYEPEGTYTYYTVLYDPVYLRFTFQVGGVTKHWSAAGWTPSQAEIAGEIVGLASQMPGGYNSPMYTVDSHVWYSGGWRDFGAGQNWGVYNTNWGYFSVVASSANTAGIWDRACPY